MKRGEYRKIIDKEEYRSSKKDLFIELQRIDFYWYDLIAKNVDIAGKDSKTSVIKQVKEFKRIVESNLNKRFIYFICSSSLSGLSVNFSSS